MLKWLNVIVKTTVLILLAGLFIREWFTPTRASWYSVQSLKSEGATWICADGSAFKDSGLTCATWLYPLGTVLTVTNVANGKSVTVKVTDRTARSLDDRIDLSKKAFESIADLKEGVIDVRVR